MEKENLVKIVSESKTINEVLNKLGKSNSSGGYKAFKKLIDKYNIDISHFLTQKEIIENSFKSGKLNRTNDDDIFCKNSMIARQVLKKRIIKNSLIPYSCKFCGNDGLWKGNKISLILDHINGVRNDNRLENLRFLCPNCNSTLITHCRGYKGIELYESKKNKKDKRKERSERTNTRKVDRPDLNILLEQVKNLGYTGTGKIYGVSDNSIRKWIKWASNRS